MARWLSYEDDLPEEGETAYVYRLTYLDRHIIFRSSSGMATSIEFDLNEMHPDEKAVIEVVEMTRAQLEGLPEFDGY